MRQQDATLCWDSNRLHHSFSESHHWCLSNYAQWFKEGEFPADFEGENDHAIWNIMHLWVQKTIVSDNYTFQVKCVALKCMILKGSNPKWGVFVNSCHRGAEWGRNAINSRPIGDLCTFLYRDHFFLHMIFLRLFSSKSLKTIL